jgi:hypothetical protein
MADNGDDSRPGKRYREAPVTVDDILEHARVIWRRKDPERAMAATTEDRDFREMFGCSPIVALACWDLLLSNNLLPDGELKHYLWCLMWLKIYGRSKTMSSLCGGVDTKTVMKWVIKFVYAIAYLEPIVVSCTGSLFLCSFPHELIAWCLLLLPD